jgi:hypothetical protein
MVKQFVFFPDNCPIKEISAVFALILQHVQAIVRKSNMISSKRQT